MFPDRGTAVTAVIDSPNEQSRGWVVDVATHRIVREGRRSVEQKEADEMSQWSELNPIEDVKAAAKAVEGSHPRRALREALEKGAELLEPSESDLRVIPIEEDSVSESVEDRSGHRGRSAQAHAHPDARELGKEHQKS
jgi:hypothetical protein